MLICMQPLERSLHSHLWILYLLCWIFFQVKCWVPLEQPRWSKVVLIWGCMQFALGYLRFWCWPGKCSNCYDLEIESTLNFSLKEKYFKLMKVMLKLVCGNLFVNFWIHKWNICVRRQNLWNTFSVINAVNFSSLSAVVVSSDNVLLKDNLSIWEVKYFQYSLDDI